MDFRDGGGYVGTGGLVRAYDERWRVFTRDHESLRVLGGLSEAGFAGFIWIFGMAGAMLAQVRSYERMTRDGERLREIMRVCECWADCLKQDLQDYLGFSRWWGPCWHRCARTSVGREMASVYECWAGCLKQDLQDLFGFSGWRGLCWHRCARTSV